MKILITENQLDKVIINFINKEFDKLKKIKYNKYNNDHYDWRWPDNKNMRAMKYTPIEQGFIVFTSFTRLIQDFFSLDNDRTKLIFEKWIMNKFKFLPIKRIQVF